jgi:hypothetical protein
VCTACGHEMSTGVTCIESPVEFPSGLSLPPVAYGREQDDWGQNEAPHAPTAGCCLVAITTQVATSSDAPTAAANATTAPTAEWCKLRRLGQCS